MHTNVHIHNINKLGFEAAADNQVEDHYQVNGQQTSKHLALFVEPVFTNDNAYVHV